MLVCNLFTDTSHTAGNGDEVDDLNVQMLQWYVLDIPYLNMPS
jgi:hypothetical protein